MSRKRCYLALEDGAVFAGWNFGAEGTAAGEVVFNTAMCGYQEILTDPSYCGQIVTMTAPLIGNYGINREDPESRGQFLSGFVVKEVARRHSNQRATGDLSSYLRDAGVVGLDGVDTRALTKRLRQSGVLRGVISSEWSDPADLVARARAWPLMEGSNLVTRVLPEGGSHLECQGGPARARIVAIDCGVKANIVRQLLAHGCAVDVVRGDTPAEAILDCHPDGVLVSNGPGDPAAVEDTIRTLKHLVGKVPIFGICLGHQLLALALGASTYKLKFGHHGANHPVLNLESGRVEITSQNHGFAVDAASLDRVGGQVSHVSLYDKSIEGFRKPDDAVFAVQYHPEAAPGPHDSMYLFQQFLSRLS